MEINALVSQMTPHPVFIVVDANPEAERLELPLRAYVAQPDKEEEQNRGGDRVAMKFAHSPYGIAELEAEGIGVGQLLRDIQTSKSAGSAKTHIEDKGRALRAMKEKIQHLKKYVEDVMEGKIPANDKVLEQIQEVFNLLPNVSDPEAQEKALCVENNEIMMGIYLGSLGRLIVALHDLILNKYEMKVSEEKKEKESTEGDKEVKKDEVKKDENKKETNDTEMKD